MAWTVGMADSDDKETKAISQKEKKEKQKKKGAKIS